MFSNSTAHQKHGSGGLNVNLVEKVIHQVIGSDLAFCKFLSANDTGDIRLGYIYRKVQPPYCSTLPAKGGKTDAEKSQYGGRMISLQKAHLNIMDP